VTESCKTKMRAGLSKNLLMGAAIVATGAVQMKEGVGQGSGHDTRVVNDNGSFLQYKPELKEEAKTDGKEGMDSGEDSLTVTSHDLNSQGDVDSMGADKSPEAGAADVPKTPEEETQHTPNSTGADKPREEAQLGAGNSRAAIGSSTGTPKPDEKEVSKITGGETTIENLERGKPESSDGEVGDQDSMQGLLGKPNSFDKDSASYEEGSS